jgi:hypothetical protein
MTTRAADLSRWSEQLIRQLHRLGLHASIQRLSRMSPLRACAPMSHMKQHKHGLRVLGKYGGNYSGQHSFRMSTCASRASATVFDDGRGNRRKE